MMKDCWAISAILFAFVAIHCGSNKSSEVGDSDSHSESRTDIETSSDGDTDTDTDTDADADTDTDMDMDTDTDTDADSDTDSDTDTDNDVDTDGDAEMQINDMCAPLPAPEGNTIRINPSEVSSLSEVVRDAQTGDTILLEDGTYHLDGVYLWFSTPGVTLRSASGNPNNVILDGNYDTTEIVTVAASDVTIAEISIQRAYTHPIHVTSSDLGDTTNTVIYRVHITDPREQSIKINPHDDRHYADNGIVACSRMILTDAGRPRVNNTAADGCYTGGVDAHKARGWTIRDNYIEGFWCPSGLSEHAVHFWTGSRDTVVERNVLVNNARGVGFGLVQHNDGRTFDDNPCPAANGAYVGHFDGVIRNNTIFGGDTGLLNSNAGFDCGVCLASACGPMVVHNTIVSAGALFSSIEWRFAGSVDVEIYNNLSTHAMRERENASATFDGNIEDAMLSMFIDAENGDLHLADGADAAVDNGVTLETGICDEDIDRELRDTPDVGADERI